MRALLRGFAVVLVLLGGTLRPWSPAQATESADLLLVLAADVSRSLDERKFRLQREGYAAALVNKRVLQAIESGPLGRIAICFVEWSGPESQMVILDWTMISDQHDAEEVAARIRGAPRPFMERTSIAGAIEFGIKTLARSPFQSTRRVIDVSGDGTHNSGGSLATSRDRALEQGIVINGLVILSDDPLPMNPYHTNPPGGLLAYYERNVIGGPGAFAMSAENFEAFGQSIASKLIKEIAELPTTRF